MCNACEKAIGLRVGWYEIPEDVRAQIIAEEPDLRPITYALLEEEPIDVDKFGIYHHVPNKNEVQLEFGWFQNLPGIVRRHAIKNVGCYVVIRGDQPWIMRRYLREYRGFVKRVQELQRGIRVASEIEQGYAFVTFSNSDWSWGEVVARGAMSGAPEWQVDWSGRNNLIEKLEYILGFVEKGS